MSIAGQKRRHLVKKLQDEADKKGRKKESKEETTRRLEESRRLEGKQKMKSGLWKQRREKDGRLVEIWKEFRKEDNKYRTPSHEEEASCEEDD